MQRISPRSPIFLVEDLRMGTNMAAGNQHKHLSLSFAKKA